MRKILAIVIMTQAPQVFAAFTETANTKDEKSAWQTVADQVQTTVVGWWSYWNAPKTDSSPGSSPAMDHGKGQQVAGNPSQPANAQASTEDKPVVQAVDQAPIRPEPEVPLFERGNDGNSLAEVRSASQSVKQAQLLSVAKAGRSGTSKLARNKAGVQVSDWKKLKLSKYIPRLDIGTEDLISRNDFQMEKIKSASLKPGELHRLAGVEPVSEAETRRLVKVPVVKVSGPRGLQANLRTAGRPLSREDVEKVKYTINSVPEYTALPYKPLSEEHMKMVAALILFEKGGSCHMIMGLFNQLAAAPATKSEATYHLGACADQLGMHQAAFDLLSSLVASEDKEFGQEALTRLAKDLPIIYEQDFYQVLKKVKNLKALIAVGSEDPVYYRMAKGAYRAKDFKTSSSYADVVSAKSEYYDDARFLSAMNKFAAGDKVQALSKLEELWKKLDASTAKNNNMRALTAVNLARMHFALKHYDKALELYMQVPKDHALWVTALTEQGWTQLALEDYSGAIGNMYSLHSPYFKAVYQPESFVVRTIGYLNICQYGDAYKTLSWLEKDYRGWSDKLNTYLQTKPSPTGVYSTVKAYIRGKSTENLEGVPFQVWRELARQKDYLNLQAALNDKQDESRRYEGVNEKIKTEKASIRSRAENSKRQFDSWRKALAKGKTDRSKLKDVNEINAGLKLEKERTIGYRFQLAILEQSRQGYLEFQKQSQQHLDKETAQLSQKSGATLLGRAEAVRSEMSRVLDNNEFLRYEVFAGSGENIRYQVADGEVGGTSNRIPASIRPTKMLNWSFDGEFWEDEIGSYRSSLQNACPDSGAGTTSEHAQNTIEN